MYRRIRELREDKDLTQSEMGVILHCSQRVYSNYERGDIDLPSEMLIKIANFHCVSLDYLLGRTNVPENPNLTYYTVEELPLDEDHSCVGVGGAVTLD